MLSSPPKNMTPFVATISNITSAIRNHNLCLLILLSIIMILAIKVIMNISVNINTQAKMQSFPLNEQK